MIIISLLVTVLLVAAGLLKYFYFDANLSTQTESLNNNVSDSIDIGVLDHVLKGFDDRATLRKNLLQEYIPARNPLI